MKHTSQNVQSFSSLLELFFGDFAFFVELYTKSIRYVRVMANLNWSEALFRKHYVGLAQSNVVGKWLGRHSKESITSNLPSFHIIVKPSAMRPLSNIATDSSDPTKECDGEVYQLHQLPSFIFRFTSSCCT